MKYEIIDWRDFNPTGDVPTFSRAIKNPNSTVDTKITLKDFMTLDTETSHNHDKEKPLCWIYQWAFSYKGQVVMGRRPTEMMECLKKIAKVNGLGIQRTATNVIQKVMIVYIHNLSFDWSFIQQWLRQAFHEEYMLYGDQMLAISAHKLITYTIGGFEFRCSYRLCGKKLETWCKELNTEHKKLVGTVDYEAIHYQDSPLTEQDDAYMANDIMALDECIRKQMEVYKDTLSTIPLTVTGYVRRVARKNFFDDRKKNVKAFKNTALDLETYTMCRNEFSGGITHGNRFYAGDTVKGVIRHRDFASFYPSQQICYTAPKGKFNLHYDHETDKREFTVEDVAKLSKDYCLLLRVAFTRLEVKKGVTMPYAQSYKFKMFQSRGSKVIEDNGRILKFEGQTVVDLNEGDLKWICSQYDIQCKVLKVYSSTRGAFPQFIIDTVNRFFIEKTVWKDKKKQADKDGIDEESDEYKYIECMLSIAKGLLNGIYGMSATDPVRWEIKENGLGYWENEKTLAENKPILDYLTENKLIDYYNGINNFMSYQLGVWTTTNARNELMEFIELVGYDNFLYCDTDSIFYISTPEIEERIEARNAYFREIDDKMGYYVEVNGKRIYYNQFELENEDITEFRFLHSKCYAYVTSDGKLHCTIAGVPKDQMDSDGVVHTRVEELGCIDNLDHDMTFVKCGGMTATYVDEPVPSVTTVNGHEIEFGSGVIISRSTKTLSDTFVKDEQNHRVEYDEPLD